MASRRGGGGHLIDSHIALLIQHLTKLQLTLDLTDHGAKDLEILGKFTALRKLDISTYWYEGDADSYDSLEGQSVALNLPNLISLKLYNIEHGEVVLSCPQLNLLSLDSTSLHIKVESAALRCMRLRGRTDNQIDLPIDQLKSLHTLCVDGVGKAYRHLIREICQMKGLQKLEITDCPSECIPNSFPQSIRELRLESYNWRQDLPIGLKDLHNLEVFQFRWATEFWDITRPLGDFLPIHGLKCLNLGIHTFSPEQIKDIGLKRNIRCTNCIRPY